MLYKIKIIPLFIIIGLIPIASIGIYFHQSSYDQIISQVENMLSTTADLERLRINDVLHLYEDKINLVGSRTNLRFLLDEYNQHESPEHVEKMNKILIDVQNSDDNFKILSIINLDGRIVASTDPTLIGNYLDDKFIPEESEDFKFGFSYQEHPVDDAYLSRTLFSDNKNLGFVYALIDPHELNRPMIKDYFGETGEYLIAEKTVEGHAIFINALKFQDDPNARVIISKDELAIPITQALLHNEVFLETVDYRGVPVFAVTRAISDVNLGLVAKIDVSEALAPLDDIKISIAVTSVLLIFAISIISILFSKTLTNPISKLELLTKEYAKGHYDSKSGLKTNDEFLSLGKSMEQMAQKMKTDKQIIRTQFKELLDKISIEQELVKSKLELETEKKFVSQKDEFSAMVSHELKTPIFPIKMYCRMLKDKKMLGTLTSEQLEVVNEIENMANSLERLTDDILDAQKLEMNKMKFIKDKFRLCDFFDEIKKHGELMAEKKDISITLDVADLEIYTDRNRLSQVITNLIRNAIKVVSENSGKIQLGAILQNGDILFYVKDNGIGIPTDKISGLFRKFYQIDTSLERTHGGTGLGLVICKGIVTELGGKIWVDSEVGKGTSFYFTIPYTNDENHDNQSKKSINGDQN